MDELKIIKHLKPIYDKSLIYTRLGFHKLKTSIPPEEQREIERLIGKAEGFLDITAAYRFLGIVSKGEEEIGLEDGTLLKGRSIARFLADSEKALIMGATGGSFIMDEIRRLQEAKRMSDAVVLDAAASEITDAGLDFVMSQVSLLLRRSGKSLTRYRYSPGYGDFHLNQQKDIYRILEAHRLGIEINQACLLLPEKSVFAVAGMA